MTTPGVDPKSSDEQVPRPSVFKAIAVAAGALGLMIIVAMAIFAGIFLFLFAQHPGLD